MGSGGGRRVSWFGRLVAAALTLSALGYVGWVVQALWLEAAPTARQVASKPRQAAAQYQVEVFGGAEVAAAEGDLPETQPWSHRRAAAAIAAIDPSAPRRHVGSGHLAGVLLWPASDQHLNSGFGYRTNPLTGVDDQLHQGVDVRAGCGTEVMAAADGVVSFADWTDSSGNTIKVTHAHGMVTRYAHLSQLDVSVGDHVNEGDLIALSGDTGALTTGPHLHFEVWQDGHPQNPMNYRYRHVATQAAAPALASCGSSRSPKMAMGSSDPLETETADDLFAQLLR